MQATTEPKVHYAVYILVALAVAALLAISAFGCAALFGEPMIPAQYAPDGTLVSGTVAATTGLVGQAADAATAAGKVGVPWAETIGGILGVIAAIGAGVQSWRLKGKVAAGEVVQLVDTIKSAGKDAGDVTAKYKPGSAFAAKVKAAYNKDRKVK